MSKKDNDSKTELKKTKVSFLLNMPTTLKNVLIVQANTKGIPLTSHILNILWDSIKPAQINKSEEDVVLKKMKTDMKKINDEQLKIYDEMKNITIVASSILKKEKSIEFSELEESILKILPEDPPISELNLAAAVGSDVYNTWIVLSKLREEEKVEMTKDGKWKCVKFEKQ